MTKRTHTTLKISYREVLFDIILLCNYLYYTKVQTDIKTLDYVIRDTSNEKYCKIIINR